MSGSESNVLSSKSGALPSYKLTTYEAEAVTELVNRLIGCCKMCMIVDYDNYDYNCRSNRNCILCESI